MAAIERVIAYIDGLNFYNGLMAKGWGRFRWLDWHALMRRYMRGEQELVAVRYFTTRMTHQPDKLARQADYLRVLELRGEVDVVAAGRFDTRRIKCGSCGARFPQPREKGTDVAIGSHLVADAAEDRYDTFALCTGDSDLAPAAAIAQQRFGKRFLLRDPPRRHSLRLADLVDLHLRMSRSMIRQSLLPDPFRYTTKKGKEVVIECPPTWRTNERTPSATEPDEEGNSFCMTCSQVLLTS